MSLGSRKKPIGLTGTKRRCVINSGADELLEEDAGEEDEDDESILTERLLIIQSA